MRTYETDARGHESVREKCRRATETMSTKPDTFRATIEAGVHAIHAGIAQQDQFRKTYLTREGMGIYDAAAAIWNEGGITIDELRREVMRAVAHH